MLKVYIHDIPCIFVFIIYLLLLTPVFTDVKIANLYRERSSINYNAYLCELLSLSSVTFLSPFFSSIFNSCNHQKSSNNLWCFLQIPSSSSPLSKGLIKKLSKNVNYWSNLFCGKIHWSIFAPGCCSNQNLLKNNFQKTQNIFWVLLDKISWTREDVAPKF